MLLVICWLLRKALCLIQIKKVAVTPLPGADKEPLITAMECTELLCSGEADIEIIVQAGVSEPKVPNADNAPVNELSVHPEDDNHSATPALATFSSDFFKEGKNLSEEGIFQIPNNGKLVDFSVEAGKLNNVMAGKVFEEVVMSAAVDSEEEEVVEIDKLHAIDGVTQPNLSPNLALQTKITHLPLEEPAPLAPNPSLCPPIDPHGPVDVLPSQSGTTSINPPSEPCEDPDLIFPLGFTPSHEEMLTLREMMKEGASLVPSDLQKEFLDSVDNAEDGEILEFFQEKFNSPKPTKDGTNYVTFCNLRRSPRIRRKPVRLDDSASSSGLKKCFLK